MTFLRLANPNILAASALLLLAGVFGLYRGHFYAQTQATRGLQTLSDMLRIEADAATVATPPAGGSAGATMPELLSRTQQMASGYDVSIGSVAINPSDAKKITLDVQGDFRDLMQFLGRLETLQVAVSAFDFAPQEGGAAGSIELTQSGKPGAPDSFADYLDALLKYTAIRNPFEIGDPIPSPDTAPAQGELTWSYHLTSITQVGAERIATIDGHDYRPGERLNDLQILRIDPSSVSLAARNQTTVQMLHFRHNPGGAAHG